MFLQLVEIPDQRTINFRIDEKNGLIIGKPRFIPKDYNWPSDLLARLRNHLQRIWNFFNDYSYWFDDSLKPILDPNAGRTSKQSIIFLLENDVWNTDEVYDDYLIEKQTSGYSVSYFRRNEKRQTFQVDVNSEEELKDWIIENAKKLIKDQFELLWNYLKTEIQTCATEAFIKLPAEILTPDYIIEQNEKIKELIDKYPEFALLNLGRIAELYILQLLKMDNKKMNSDALREAKADVENKLS